MSTKELIDEMIRQRLTQDYQLVPPSHVNASNYRGESLRSGVPVRPGEMQQKKVESVRYFLSMGHRLQVLTHDPASDTVEVTRYNAKESQAKRDADSYTYYYYSFSKESSSYTKVVQTFTKYSTLYNWNKLDRIVCGNTEREMDEDMRSRRVMFGLIPDSFETDTGKEQEYVSKFRRLLEYFEKLRKTGDLTLEPPLDIEIVLSTKSARVPVSQIPTRSGIERDAMKRFYVHLKRRKQDPMEWIEIAVDSTFNTIWSFRIIVNWLVASSAKVDTQIQLLQRRCSQYGLNLIPLPHVSVSADIFLNPFRAPAIFSVRDADRDQRIEDCLLESSFVYDGKFPTNARDVVECIKNGKDFRFARYPRAMGHQLLHRSGTLFVRVVRDLNDVAMIVAFANARFIRRDKGLRKSLSSAFITLRKCIEKFDTPHAATPSASIER